MISIACAALTAIALILGLGTPDVWPVAWVAAIPILWLAYGNESTRRVAVAAWASYFIGQFGMLWPYRTAMGVLVLAIAAVPALAFMGVVLAARLAARRLPLPAAALAFPALWTGWEIVSSTASPHGTFGAWAYSQLSAPVMVQSASLLGLWIVSFVIAFFASSVALGARHRAPRLVAAACALVIANLTFGAWTLSRPAAKTMRVAGAARDHDDRVSPEQVAIAQAEEARRLAADGARVVVFEEKVALLHGEQRDAVLAPLIAAARETGATIVAGFEQTTPEHRNIAFTITPDSRIRSYTKRHHIPGLESGFTIGSSAGLLGGGEAVAICKDFDFQKTLRGDAAAGASAGGVAIMFAPSWDFDADGWLHARMALMRNVEGGFALVRPASNGIIILSDAHGRVLAKHPSGTTRYAAAIADVPLGAGPTPYLRIGDAFAWLAGAVGLLLVGWSVLASTRIAPSARAAGATTPSVLAPPAPARSPS